MRIIASAILASILFSGCVEDREVDSIQKAMASFIYVGEAPDLSESTVGPHGFVQVSLPSRFMTGMQYIFHRKRDGRNSWDVITEGLQSVGATIIDAPQGNKGLAFAILGGPFFVIEFRVNKRSFWLTNHIASDTAKGLSGEMENEDYILRITADTALR